MKVTPSQISSFQKVVKGFYKKNKRDFPWRNTSDPYHIYVSEVMLQQTQTTRVAEKFPPFIARFPTWKKLAQAKPSEVLEEWQGLGYNRRGLSLHKAAQMVVDEFKGTLPDDTEQLVRLPGIGPATAASIAAFAFNKPTVFIETNIRAVIIHHFFPGRDDVTDDEIRPLVESTLDTKKPYHWYSAMMDYGVMLKKTHPNPSRKSKQYRKQSKFEGSNRQLRGKALKLLLKGPHTIDRIAKQLNSTSTDDKEKIKSVIGQLLAEGFIEKKGQSFVVK